MTRALLVVDEEVAFTEIGNLPVQGGEAVCAATTTFLRRSRASYALVAASRDLHQPGVDNGGHFSATPDYVTSFPPHGEAETPDCEYHPAFDHTLVDVHVVKGWGHPAFSPFEGHTAEGEQLHDVLQEAGVTDLDICGIATGFCVNAAVSDALRLGYGVRLLLDLCADVDPSTTDATVAALAAAGAQVVTSDHAVTSA